MAGLSDETRRLLELTSTATLTTQLFKRGLRNTFVQGVRRLTPGAPVMVGEAFTLRMIPAREDLDHPGMFADRSHPQRRAIEECPAGRGAGDRLPQGHPRRLARRHPDRAPDGARASPAW